MSSVRLIVSGGDRTMVVDWDDGAGRVLIDGQPAEAEVLCVRPGVYSVLAGGRSFEVVVQPATSEDGRRAVTVDGRALDLLIEDTRARAAHERRGGQRGHGGGGVTVVAPMPGRIAAVPAKTGDPVERGQPVVILEAMKMESVLTAPHPGTVVEVLVTPGQAVQQRQPLLRIE